MSLVSTQLFINRNTLAASNGSYGVQQASQNLTNMTANARGCVGLSGTVRRENQIMFGSLQNQLATKIAWTSLPGLKEQQDKNIKSTFNYFA
jgi:DNA-binding transcriptional regulator LsrR (DeoR family)